MRLKILDYTYVPSQTFLFQGKSRGKKKPGKYRAGGNGTEIRGENPQVLVDLENVDTGEISYHVNVYLALKLMTYGHGKLTKNRVHKIMDLYQSRQPFEAEDWDEWEEVPGLERVFW